MNIHLCSDWFPDPDDDAICADDVDRVPAQRGRWQDGVRALPVVPHRPAVTHVLVDLQNVINAAARAGRPTTLPLLGRVVDRALNAQTCIHAFTTASMVPGHGGVPTHSVELHVQTIGKNVDMTLAVFALRQVQRWAASGDRVAIWTGDIDFLPLLDALDEGGVPVTLLLSPGPTTSLALRQSRFRAVEVPWAEFDHRSAA